MPRPFRANARASAPRPRPALRLGRAKGAGPQNPGPQSPASASATAPKQRRPVSARTRRWLFWLVLGLVAAALYAVAVPVAVAVYRVPIEVVFILVAAHVGALPLAVWRPREASVLAIVAFFVLALVSTGGSETAPWPWTVPALITQVLVLAVVAWKDRWWWAGLAWLLSGVASLLASVLLISRMMLGSSLTDVIVFANIAVFAIAAAIVVRQLQRTRVQLAVERTTSESERARREVLDERARIARELHDVVAHGMSILNVQATSAPYRHPGLPAELVTEFEQIAAQTRTTLGEMRRLLGVLRSEEPDAAGGHGATGGPGGGAASDGNDADGTGTGAPQTSQTLELAPQPSLAQLPALIEQARQAGAEIRYEPGDALERPVDDIVGLSAYRIVQEALSNALRHAPGSAVTVTVARDSRTIELAVTNGPPRTAPRRDTGQLSGAGFGLRGMRERASAVGGTVQYGTLPDGGYRVDAVLPAQAGGAS